MPAPAYRQVYPSQQQSAYRVQRSYPTSSDNGYYYSQRDYQPAYPAQRYNGYSN